MLLTYNLYLVTDAILLVQSGVDGDGMFDRPIITLMLKEQPFFKTLQKGGMGITGNEAAFNSTSYYQQHEKEIAPSMLALACASVRLIPYYISSLYALAHFAVDLFGNPRVGKWLFCPCQ